MKDDKTVVKLLINGIYDYQRLRISFGNRLKLKSNGEAQVIPEAQGNWKLSGSDADFFTTEYQLLTERESVLEKRLKAELKQWPIWTEFLSSVTGIGPLTGGVIVSTYDIAIATTVSKLWQYTGLNSGMVRGLKLVKNIKDVLAYEPKNGGEVVHRYPKAQQVIVRTNEMVRGDKLTEGFIAPFNIWLRTKMIGVLASSMIKSQSMPYVQYYYGLHMPLAKVKEGMTPGRLDLSEKICYSEKPPCPWKETSDGHRNNAAKRYMIKRFLLDLYVAWRTLDGLPVRPPYSEEYLGHIHGIPEPV